MFAGRLRDRIDIERPAETRGAAGSVVQEFELWLTNEPAAVEPLQSKEFFAARQLQSQITTRIRMRWIAGVTSKMRVRHVTPEGTQYYAIEGPPVNPKSRCRELQLMCVMREADGWRT